ncbi:enoyl-[acyl-carrier protein] reductase I [Allocatelliglobosispora scoriae]|uniref:Enoyl-[acyl-carrier-protein] reductase [NADH] n=1 Tax=Allocatelliglobosispora scoriae TaxID=643052 RepID=A0A841BGH3_9ACTN|nr:enoyl-ACP reductase FabI [Allocatelliglobosispora scoriae]MBB5866735.1 enoyl-[acyl-carrier protein] reductase I [Allocatelliglobosispora scoriae]
MSGILAGKRLLITGVLTRSSIAFEVARIAQEQGAVVVLTGYGRLQVVEHTARQLPDPPPVIELDVTNAEHLSSLPDRLRPHLPHLDGVLHAIAYGPAAALGGDFLATSWADASRTLEVSTYSLQALTAAALPMLTRGSAIVGIDFDATVAWPSFNWMGVAKAGLESCARYLARDLGPRGIRVNLVAAGPLRTVAARGVPGFDDIAADWVARAPLGWDPADTTAAARTCAALLSDWFPATTGEVVHADGGYHSIGA